MNSITQKAKIFYLSQRHFEASAQIYNAVINCQSVIVFICFNYSKKILNAEDYVNSKEL